MDPNPAKEHPSKHATPAEIRELKRATMEHVGGETAYVSLRAEHGERAMREFKHEHA